MTTLKIKLLHPAARMPEYKTDGASGMDLCAVEGCTIGPGETKLIPLGIALEIPDGFEAQIRPRSSLNVKGILSHFGTIDADYRGQISAVLTNTRPRSELPVFGVISYEVQPGDRIAQLVIAPVERVAVVAADELTATGRGAGGFGHTGR